MTADDTARLLERVGVLRSRCDLDLLIFFARHPTALLTSEQLASWLGHALRAIAASLDVLLDAGIISREQNPSHAARMYVFSTASPAGGGWLPSLLRLAKTRGGRLALIEALRSRAGGDAPQSVSRNAIAAMEAPVLSLVRTSNGDDTPNGSNPPDRESRHG
jgi:hypothetical protein